MADDDVPRELTFPARDVEAAHRRSVDERRQFLIDSVWSDTMLPSEAEAMAEGTGLLFDGSDGPVTLGSPRWSLAQAVVWIAWREPERIQEQWWRLHAWSGSLWRDPPTEGQAMTFEQAEADLWTALEAGRVHATGLPGHGSRPATIEPLDWSNLVWMPEKQRLSVRWFGRSDTAYRIVEVRSADMLAVWPASGGIAPETEKPKEQRPASTKGGRVLAEHWHDMWAEVCRIIHDEGVPTDRLALVKRMQQWFEDQSLDAPASQKLNPVLERLFIALRR